MPHAQTQVTPNFKPETSKVEAIARAMISLNATGGATRDRLIEEHGFSGLDLDMYGPAARRRANEMFVRKDGVADPYARAIAAATDDLAREDVEGTRRTLLVRVPAADLCQLWAGLRSEGCSPREATLRVSAAFLAEGVAP